MTHGRPRSPWILILSASGLLLVTMGLRQSLGLFVSPINTATGLGVASISLALAVGQFVWGVAQPVFGAVADRYGPGRVIVLGGILLAAGMALTPLAQTQWGMILTVGVLMAAGAGAGSFSILIGATASRLPPERRAVAAGVINAGGSLGQTVFAPISQALIGAFGWVSAMLALSIAALATLPLALPLRKDPVHHRAPGTAKGDMEQTLRAQLRAASRDRNYWLVHAAFFTCGFHVAFLVTHLPGEVNLCGLNAGIAATSLAIIGLANVAGSLAAGALGNVYRMKSLLFWVYFIRAVAIAAYLAAPKTALTFYVFAAVLGLTWLSTVPPTAGLVGKLFGMRYLATLFGLTLLSHQIGGFLGAWLGGLAVTRLGSYSVMWWIDMALALAAALLNLPIEERHPGMRTAAA